MPTRTTILGPDGRPLRVSPAQRLDRAVRARYDAAQTNNDNAAHWANADALSARAANSPEVRLKLRTRARYERDNNTYCSGLVETVANDTIGTGPRLQVLTDDPAYNDDVAAEFETWTAAVGMAEKLRTFREARAVDGESFIQLFVNQRLRTPARLDLNVIEADRVAAPYAMPYDVNDADGIRYDADGNAIAYTVLRYHPGDTGWFGGQQFDEIPAADIIHWFKVRRPGQRRGVPEITPALPLFALLRRYTLAALSAAETAAMFAAVIKSTLPPDDDAEALTAFDTQALERGLATVLPEGYDLSQLKAEQPTTTYPQFKSEILREIARCLNVPYIVAAGDASGANYSSGRLDYQVYDRSIGVDQYFLECAVLDRIFTAWLDLMRATGRIPAGQDRTLPPHQWFWDGRAYIDPEAESNAATTRLANLTTTLADEWAARGHDWRAKLRQRSEEIALMNELGLTPTQAAPAAAPTATPEPAMSGSAPIKVVRASATTTPKPVSLACAASFEFQAAEAADGGEPRLPRFSIVGYTGAPMMVSGYFHPVIVDLAGLQAASQEIPALRSHDHDRVVGQTDSVSIDASGVRMTGNMTGDNADTREIVTHAKNRFKWQASIGADPHRTEFLKPGSKATVNGRDVAGPLFIVRTATLKEISFVALGADGQTAASVAASNPSGTTQGALSMFEQWLQAKGFDPAALTDEMKTTLKAAYDAEQAPPAKKGAEHGTGEGSQNLDQILGERRKEEARIQEITKIVASFVDERPLQIDEIENAARYAIEAKTDPKDFKLQLYERLRAKPSFGFSVGKPGKVNDRVLEAALCRTGGLGGMEDQFDEQTLDIAATRFKHGLGLRELLIMAARENGYTGHSVSNVGELLEAAFVGQTRYGRTGGIRAAGFSTYDLSGILSNTANKFLLQAFMAVESFWREIAAITSVRDFKTITSYSLTGDFKYRKIPPGGQIEHGTAGEETYTNKANTYGRMFAINHEDIINDDLGALTQVPQRMGRGAALSFNEVFWAEFMDNASFFTSGNGNYISGATVGTDDSRLGIEGLTRAETAFFALTDPDGNPLGATPAVLLVPNALNATAFQLMNSTEVRDTTSSTLYGTANPHAGKYRVARSSYLSNTSYTGYSSTAWYLIADPMDLPVIGVAFLNGQQTPTVESASADFDRLGIQMRAVHYFGVKKYEYRAGLKSKGAA